MDLSFVAFFIPYHKLSIYEAIFYLEVKGKQQTYKQFLRYLIMPPLLECDFISDETKKESLNCFPAAFTNALTFKSALECKNSHKFQMIILKVILCSLA